MKKETPSNDQLYQPKGLDSKKWYWLLARLGIFMGVLTGWIIFYIIFMKIAPANIDSFYYLSFFKWENLASFHGGGLLEYIMQYAILLIVVVPFISGYLMYKLLKSMVGFKTAIITATLFMIDPLIHFNQRIGLYDKNPLIICFTLLVLNYIFSKERKNVYTKILQYAMLPVLIFLGWFVWEGSYFIFIILLTTFVLTICFKHFLGVDKNITRAQVTGGIIFLVLCIGVAILKYAQYFNDIMYIREMWPVIFSPVFMIFPMIIILFSYITIKIRLGEYTDMLCNEIFWFSLVSFTAGFFVYRFMIFASIGFYIMLGLILFEKKLSSIPKIYYVLIGIGILMSYPMYTGDSYTNCHIEETIHYAQSLNKNCILSDWGKGHLYDYYSYLPVRFKAHPNKAELMTAFTSYDENCVYILDEDDRMILNYMLDNKTLVTDLMNKRHFMTYTDDTNTTKCGYTVFTIHANNTNITQIENMRYDSQ